MKLDLRKNLYEK